MPVDGFEADMQSDVVRLEQMAAPIFFNVSVEDKAHISRVLAERQELLRQLAEQGEKLKAAEDLNVFFRNSVGECHVMISRNASEYQIQKQWDATELPARLQKLMKAAEAERDGLKERTRSLELAIIRTMAATGIELDNPSGDLADELANVMQAFVMDRDTDVKALEQRIAGAKVCSHIYTRVALTSTTNCPACINGIAWPEPAEQTAAPVAESGVTNAS